jgi:hypothetical protein
MALDHAGLLLEALDELGVGVVDMDAGTAEP